MDYLITNGYPAAANKFAVEANIQLRTDLQAIQERVDIRTAIHSGDIQSAIEKINELNPQVRITVFSYHITSSHFASMIISVSCTTHKTLRGVAEKHSSSVLSMISKHTFTLQHHTIFV
jgi:hypothetical protein